MVLSAAITNSVEAIENKGIIKVSVRQSKIDEQFIKKHPDAETGSYICLCVQDNGCGMDQETLERIFEPFFTTKFQGRGLGMASVYGIVKNHNGYITVDSEPGSGTKVQIFFPLLKEIVEEEPVELSAPEKGSGTIFLIEDEELVIEIGIKLLEHLGYRTLSAKNGEEALHIAKTFDGTIDLTLLDMGLPDIPGEVLYFHLKEALPDLKVIVCSGYKYLDISFPVFYARLKAGLQPAVQCRRVANLPRAMLENFWSSTYCGWACTKSDQCRCVRFYTKTVFTFFFIANTIEISQKQLILCYCFSRG